MNLRTISAFVLIGLASSFSNADSASSEIQVDMSRCAEERQGDARVYSGDFKWGMSLQEIRDSAVKMYDSEKRLAERAYYDRSLQQFVFPIDEERGGKAKIPATFIKAVTRHIEKGFARGYVDAVLFPDMGHSHFLIPMDEYKRDIEPLPVNQYNVLYEKIMSNKNVKVVYHTAEQLRVTNEEKKLLDDKYLQWRYYTRNLVGHNNVDPDIELVNATATSAANTMSEQSGYYWWGGGFNVHANKNGCFSYKRDGKTYYFDISLKDLEPDPNSGDFARDNFSKNFEKGEVSRPKIMKCNYTNRYFGSK